MLATAKAAEAEALAILKAAQVSQDASLNGDRYTSSLKNQAAALYGVGQAAEKVTAATPIPASYAAQIEATSKSLEGWQQVLNDLQSSVAVGIDVDDSQVLQAKIAVKMLGDELAKLRRLDKWTLPDFYIPPSVFDMTLRGPGGFGPESGRAIAESGKIAAKKIAEESETEKARISKAAADDFRSRVEAAAQTFKDKIGDALGTTKGNIAGLAPEIAPGQPGYELSRLLKEGPLAPGANGPTEKLYQLLEAAFAPGGGKWGPELGVTPEYAQSVMRMIGMGDMYNPEVQRWINQPGLEAIAGGPEGAKAALEAQAAQMGVVSPKGAAGTGVQVPGVDVIGPQMTTLTGALDALNKTMLAPPATTTGAGATIGTISVVVAPGAVVVSGKQDATGMGELVGQTIAGALKALSQAEQRVNVPPSAGVPGV